MSTLDSKLSYVLMHRFLQKLWENGNDDLGSLLGGMCLSLDGERSMDHAMVYDWVEVTKGKQGFTDREAFVAARDFLESYYKRGALPEVKVVLTFMGNAAQQEPNTHALTLWHACWDEVHENLQRGVPFKTAYSYGRDREDRPGRFERNERGDLEVVLDAIEKGT